MKTLTYTHKPEVLKVIEVTIENVDYIASVCGYDRYTVDRYFLDGAQSVVRFFKSSSNAYGRSTNVGSYVGISEHDGKHVFYKNLEEVEVHYEKKEKSAGKRRKSDAVREGVQGKDPC